jgi:hypothetical protein
VLTADPRHPDVEAEHRPGHARPVGQLQPGMGAVVRQQRLRLLVSASGLDDPVELLLAHGLPIIAAGCDILV